MKIALVNFTHSDTTTGGVETRYGLLRRAFESAGHACVCVSTNTMTLDQVMLETTASDVVVMDSAIGLVVPRPTITVFGNAWRGSLLVEDNEHVKHLIRRETAWHGMYRSYRVAVSAYMREQEMAPGGICADCVIPNPVDLDRFSEPVERPRRPVILWAGPRVPVKCPGVVDAIRQRLGKAVMWEFTSSRESPRSREQMSEVIRGSSLVLCTSVAEGCNNTLMEAIAADVPIVTTTTGLFWRWWDDRLGVRMSPSSLLNDWIHGIATVLTDPGAFRPRQAALENRLDYETWAVRWRGIVEDCAWRESFPK